MFPFKLAPALFAQIFVALMFVAVFLIAAPSYGQGKKKYILHDQSSLLLTHARVIDVIAGKALEDQALLIVGGKIQATGKTGTVKAPADVKVIDLTGKTIVPGLVMLHEHMNYNTGAGVWHLQTSFPKLYLAGGVTTLRTAGAENPTYDLNLKREIDGGRRIGPRMFVTGPMFNDVSGGFLGDFVIANYEQGKKATAFWAEQGCTSFKVYTDISTEALRGVVEEAHSRGLAVTGHLGKMSCTEAANLGIDNIEHSFGSCLSDLRVKCDSAWNIRPSAPEVKQLIDLLVSKKVALTATPFADSNYFDPALAVYLSPDEQKRVAEMKIEQPFFLPRESNDSQLRPLERMFARQGGRLLLGADAADLGLVPGFQDHNVMISMVKAGWTPMEVIRLATIDGATFLKAENEIGSVTIGKTADLLIVDGKPDQQMTDIRKISIVFRNGVGYDPEALRESVRGLIGRY